MTLWLCHFPGHLTIISKSRELLDLATKFHHSFTLGRGDLCLSLGQAELTDFELHLFIHY